VFLQELGVPNPVTNEFVLLLAGYLAFEGVLNLWAAILTAVAADCLGTIVLYVIFYRAGGYFMAHRPKWFPIRPDHVERLASTISKRRLWGIYVGRLIPFLRGYASVAAGLVSIRPQVFIPAVVISAITWSGGYVVAGRLLGPYWEQVAKRIGGVESVVLVLVLVLLTTVAVRAILSARRARV